MTATLSKAKTMICPASMAKDMPHLCATTSCMAWAFAPDIYQPPRRTFGELKESDAEYEERRIGVCRMLMQQEFNP